MRTGLIIFLLAMLWLSGRGQSNQPSSFTAATVWQLSAHTNYHLGRQNYLYVGGNLQATPQEQFTGLAPSGPLSEFDRAHMRLGLHYGLQDSSKTQRTFLNLKFTNTFLPRTKRTITNIIDDTIFVFTGQHQLQHRQTYSVGIIDYGKLYTLTFIKRLHLAWLEEPDGSSYGQLGLGLGLQKNFILAQKPLHALLSFDVTKEFAHDDVYAQTLRFFQSSTLQATVVYFVHPKLGISVFGAWHSQYYKVNVTNTNEGNNFNLYTPQVGAGLHWVIGRRKTAAAFNTPSNPYRWLR